METANTCMLTGCGRRAELHEVSGCQTRTTQCDQILVPHRQSCEAADWDTCVELRHLSAMQGNMTIFTTMTKPVHSLLS